jgi:putative oxidoreductase
VNKFLFGPFVEGRAAFGLTLFRIVTGIALMIHGLPKIQAPFSWMPPSSGVHSVLQSLAAISEFGGGLALVLGLLTPVACLGIFFTMSYAILMVHMAQGDPWIGKGRSFEPALSYLIAAVTLFLTGPGKYSLDAKLFGKNRIAKKIVKEPVAA